MTLILINQVTIILFCIALLCAAYQDMSEYKISNRIVLSVLGLLPVYLLTSPIPDVWIANLGVGFLSFIIGIFLFKAGIMGGGDVKLISACLLIVGLDGLIFFFVGMALMGGAMGLFMISPFRHPMAYYCGQFGLFEAQTKLLTNKLPYGVAICVGGIFAAFQIFPGL